MRGLILAAGRGRRLGPLGADRPKCLVPVGGRPLLDWQMEAFARAGIRDVAIVRGFAGDSIDVAATYLENPRWEVTNMVSSLRCAAEWLAGADTVVSYADLVYPARAIERLAAPRAAQGALATFPWPDIAVLYDPAWRELWQRRFVDPRSDAETFRLAADGNTLAEIGARAGDLDAIEGQYMGLLRLTPAGSGRIFAEHTKLDPVQQDRLDMTGVLRRLLAAGTTIGAVAYDSWWCEIDTARDLSVAEEIVRRETTQ